jgi:hypothetical protein
LGPPRSPPSPKRTGPIGSSARDRGSRPPATQITAARTNPAATPVAQANTATMHDRNPACYPNTAGKNLHQLTHRRRSQPNEHKSSLRLPGATPKYAPDPGSHSGFDHARLLFFSVSRSCHSATRCREGRCESRPRRISTHITASHNFAPLRTTILRLALACSFRCCGARDVMRFCCGKEAHSRFDTPKSDASAGAASDHDDRSALYRLQWGWSAASMHEGPARPRRPTRRWRVHLLDRRRSMKGEGGAMPSLSAPKVRKCRTLEFVRCTLIA